MLFLIRETLFPARKLDDVMKDVRWIMLLISGIILQAGLLLAIGELQSGYPYFIVAGVFIITAILPWAWLRFLVIAVGTAGLIYDFTKRWNPFSVAFILMGLHHLFLLGRAMMAKTSAPPPAKGVA